MWMSETGDRVGSKYIVWTDGVLAIVWVKDIGMWKKKTDIEGSKNFCMKCTPGDPKIAIRDEMEERYADMNEAW